LIVFQTTCDEIESTYRLFTAANDDRDLANFASRYFCTLENLSVEDFRSQVEKWVTEENVNLFTPSPLEVVTREICNLSTDLIEFHKWKDIAFYLIAKIAKPHELNSEFNLGARKPCLLEVAVTSAAHPFDAQTIGPRFLEMLDASNVDLAEYLTFERHHHLEGLLAPETPILTYHSPFLKWLDPRTIKLYISEEQPFLLSWDWWVDPKEPAFIVLHEFRHFGQAEYPLYDEYNPLVYWPFIYPKWTFGLNKWADEGETTLLKRLQQRSDHRWQKKIIKQAKIQGTYKRPKIPGTWID
jgi:hypothetical protein